VKAIVLVGGTGTRLRPLTLRTPKQMLPIIEQPMIERVLSGLARGGIEEAVLSLGYLPDAFMRAYPGGEAAGVHLTYAVEPEPYDTAGAVRFAADTAGIDDTFLVVNGDVLTDLDVSTLIDFHRSCGAEGTIRLYPVEDPSAFGVVDTDDDGRVRAFIEKPPAGEAPSDLINAGTYVFEPSVLERIAPGRRTSIERKTFPEMVADGVLFARADPAYWLDTGTPADFLAAHADLLNGKRPGPPCPGAYLVSPGVWATGTPGFDGEAVAPCFVGAGARIAPGARIEGSVVGRGAVVDAGAVVVSSVLMARTYVGVDARIEGSILGEGALIGEGCRLRPISVVGPEVEVEPGTVLDGQRIPA
jgi:mannose-1-phosphate guanylyltransferase